MYPVTQDFLDKMKADRRQVSAKAEISYTDPFIDQSINIAVSEKANVSYEQQTADAVDTVPYKWASLDGSWVLDGSYHLAPTPDKLSQYQFGWWGSQLSGADGSFVSPYPTLTVTHFARPIHTLTVVGDSARGEYPTDFTIDLYASDGTKLYTKSVTGNNQVNWSFTLPSPVLDVVKQVLTITKWNIANRQAKITEFFTSIQETYMNDDIVKIDLLEEREASQGSLPVGNISANEVTLTLVNKDKKFNVDNTQSPLNNLLKPNRKIKLWLGTEAENNYTDKPPTFTRNSVAYKSDGTQVTANTPRFEQGYFDNAIMIEEGTTNLVSDPFFKSGISGWGNATWTTLEWLSSVYNPFSKQNGVMHLYDNDNSTGYCAKTISISRATYTVSVLLKILKGNISKIGVSGIIFYTDSTYDSFPTNIYDVSAIFGQGVYKLVSTLTPNSSKTISRYEMRIAHNDTLETELYVYAVQLEAKPYATSFIDGTRAAESLTIPTAGVLNPQEGTVECWVYFPPNGRWSVAGQAPTVFWAGSNSTGVVPNQIYADIVNQGTLRLVIYDSANNYKLLQTVSKITPGWHYLAYKWDASGPSAILVDGVKWGVTTVGTGTGICSSTERFTLGFNGYDNARHIDSLIDDLRISSRARTDEEIAAAYASGQPLQKDDSTTYLLPFNGSIYPAEQVWVPLGTFWSLDWDSPDDVLEATVTARDRLELLRKGTYQSSTVQTNVSLYTLAEQVLQDAGLDSTEYNIDTALQSIIVPYAWFNSTTHREALRTIAEAALAVVYADRDGIIQIKSFNSVGTDILEITEDDYFLPLRNPSQQSQVSNKIIVNTNPLTPQATQEVYRSNNPITVPANGSTTTTVFYNQTPVINAVASIDGSPSGISIASATYYGWGASVKIQNTNSTSASVTLVITGQPLTVQNKEQYIASDSTSITENGELRYEYPDNPLIQTLIQAQQIATTLLASVKDARRDIQMDWRGNPALLLGDKISVKGNDYYVIRQEISWQGYLEANLTGRKVE